MRRLQKIEQETCLLFRYVDLEIDRGGRVDLIYIYMRHDHNVNDIKIRRRSRKIV